MKKGMGNREARRIDVCEGGWAGCGAGAPMVLKQACGSNGFHFSLHLGCVCAATAEPVPVVVMVFSLSPWEIYIFTV